MSFSSTEALARFSEVFDILAQAGVNDNSYDRETFIRHIQKSDSWQSNCMEYSDFKSGVIIVLRRRDSELVAGELYNTHECSQVSAMTLGARARLKAFFAAKVAV